MHNPDTKLSIGGISLAEGDQIKVDFPEGDDENHVIAHSEMTPPFVKSTEAKKVRITFMSSKDSIGEDGFFLHYQGE